jgi:hypothetical protein
VSCGRTRGERVVQAIRCPDCGHSASMHDERGCGNWTPGTKHERPLPCGCRRNAIEARSLDPSVSS